jgi:hypothetical protein
LSVWLLGAGRMVLCWDQACASISRITLQLRCLILGSPGSLTVENHGFAYRHHDRVSECPNTDLLQREKGSELSSISVS